jgi:hypothetical protein
MAKLTFIPTAVGKSTLTLSLDDIPQDVKNDVEEVYKTLKTNTGRMRVEFPSVGELNAYVTQVTSYCAQRPAGRIRFRKSPSRGLPATAMEFRITDELTPNEAEVASINESVQDVKNAAQ